MKNLALAITLIATAGSASAFFNDSNSNTSGYGNGDFAGQGQGRAAGHGKFTMTIKAKGSADMAGNSNFDGRDGFYGAGYGEDGYNSATNGNFWNDGNVVANTSGAGSATGDFEMTVNAEGSADGNLSADANSNTGVYGQGYSQPYYGYAPYYSNAQ